MFTSVLTKNQLLIDGLNQKWQELVRPKVAVLDHHEIYERAQQTTLVATVYSAALGLFNTIFPQTTQTEPELHQKMKWIAKNYQFGTIVSKIQKLQSEGKSICLFIGRTIFERLPSDDLEAEPNEVWISGDVCLAPYYTAKPDYSSEPTSLHFWLDFNQQAGLDMIQGLFDKIFIDKSTTKFLGDFTKRFAGLLRGPASVMVFPAPTSLSFPMEKIQERFEPSSNCFVMSFITKMALIKRIKQENPELDVKSIYLQADVICWQKGYEHTKHYLESIYNKVEMLEGKRSYSCLGEGTYFIVSVKKNFSEIFWSIVK